MGASNCADLKFSKGKPRVMTQREQKAALKAEDDYQRGRCHARSMGRCEVLEVIPRPEDSAILTKRCKGKAVHNHHLMGGNGRRNVGDSILAEHRVDLCKRCHQDVEAEILRPADQDKALDAATVTYERRKTF